jgi:superfamily II DNA or RNA helicase
VRSWSLAGEPRAWQESALAEWRDRGRKGIARVVTGAGKTYFAQMCIADWAADQPDGRIIIVVPTLALLDQWYVDLEEDLGVKGRDIAVYSGEQRATAPAPINLMVLNTARSQAREISRNVPSFLIVDECHRAAAPANAQALKGEHDAALGLSATPERQYDDGLGAVLVPALGPIMFTYGYDEARRDGVITEFVLVNVGIELSPDEQAEYDRLTKRVGMAVRRYKNGEDDGSRLKIVLRQRASVSANADVRIPVAVALADRHRGRRTVIFHESIAAAESIQRVLAARDHNATLYHSRISPAVRRDNLRLFRRGAFSVLVSCRALDEGVNVPETEIGIIASSTASTRQRIQRMGRVLRPAARKDSATVYTLYATEIEERRLQEEAEKLEAAKEVRWQKAEHRA